jgi:hypothetical protein
VQANQRYTFRSVEVGRFHSCLGRIDQVRVAIGVNANIQQSKPVTGAEFRRLRALQTKTLPP